MQLRNQRIARIRRSPVVQNLDAKSFCSRLTSPPPSPATLPGVKRMR